MEALGHIHPRISPDLLREWSADYSPFIQKHPAKRITFQIGTDQIDGIVKRQQIECRNALLMRKNASKTAFYLSICKTDTNRSIL